MDRHGSSWAAVGRLGIGAAIGSIAALAWIVTWIRRGAARDVARSSLWPRPDGSTRSFGEVWDFADSATWPPAGPGSPPSGPSG